MENGLPLPGGGSKGGGFREGQDIDPPETEYGRAIYCDKADSGDLRGGAETMGDTGPPEMVGTDGHLLEVGQGEGSISGGERTSQSRR